MSSSNMSDVKATAALTTWPTWRSTPTYRRRSSAASSPAVDGLRPWRELQPSWVDLRRGEAGAVPPAQQKTVEERPGATKHGAGGQPVGAARTKVPQKKTTPRPLSPQSRALGTVR